MSLIRELEELIGIAKKRHSKKRSTRAKSKSRKRTGPRKKNGEFRKKR